MNRKLIFLDVDGTLTSIGRDDVPESAVRAVRQARKNGHLVFVCSGRSVCMLKNILPVGFDGFVTSAGGYVEADGRVLFDCPMTEELLRRTKAAFDACGASYLLEGRDETYCGGEPLEHRFRRLAPADCTEAQIQAELAVMEQYEFLPPKPHEGQPVYKISFQVDSEELLAGARGELEKDFFVCMQRNWFGSAAGEIINRAFDKGEGVRRIAEYYGADLADTIAFGDSMNDMAMAGVAGLCVCMGGGDPNFAAKCDMTAPSPAEDGIAKTFAKLGLV